jgi:hypothetical protein
VSIQLKSEHLGPILKKKKPIGSFVQYNIFKVTKNWRARTYTCGAEILDFLDTLFFMVKRGWLPGLM